MKQTNRRTNGRTPDRNITLPLDAVSQSAEAVGRLRGNVDATKCAVCVLSVAIGMIPGRPKGCSGQIGFGTAVSY